MCRLCRLDIECNLDLSVCWVKRDGFLDGRPCIESTRILVLAKQILGISSNQIEREHNFSTTWVLPSLHTRKLGLTNLDALVIIYKNWPYDAWLGVAIYNDIVDEFFKDKVVLLDESGCGVKWS